MQVEPEVDVDDEPQSTEDAEWAEMLADVELMADEFHGWPA